MKILMVITYYTPHVSGLTIYVKRIGEELARRGHQVTVVAAQHRRDLPREEVIEGVSVVRLPVLLKVSKGAIPPTMPWDILRLVRRHDVVHMHLPLLGSSYVAWAANLPPRKKSIVATYHCDLLLPPAPFSRAIEGAMNLSHGLAARQVDTLVTYTRDYAENSPFLSRFPGKVATVYPPIVIEPPDPVAAAEWRRSLGLEGCKLVGFAGRFSADKGGEYLLRSIPEVLAALPEARYVFAGEYQRVVGENHYQKVGHLIEQHKDRVLFLGELHGRQLSNFYSLCDVLTLPSINSTESFGMVQVEAMLCGTPVVAADIPGVREPVRVSGMGLTVPPRDPHALAQALVEVVTSRAKYTTPRIDLAATFSLKQTADFYERLYVRGTEESRL